MTGVSLYTTFLCDEDSDCEEVQALESEMKSLIRRKFELECQLYVPQPRKFKEIEAVAPISKSYGSYKEWDLSNLEMKMHFNKLCGIYATYVDSGIKIYFKTSHSDEYFVDLKEEKGGFVLEKYHLPPIVPIKDLCDYLSSNKKELRKFCHKIYHFIVIFEDRLQQVQALKMSSCFENIELFCSHSTEYVKVETNIMDAIEYMQKISVHLQYRPDFVFPQKINFDFLGIKDEEKSLYTERCQVFKSMPLLDAIRIALL